MSRVGNSAARGGGVWGGRLWNCIVYFNYASDSGSTNWHDVISFTSSCTTTGQVGWASDGNITNDPMFIDKGSGSGMNFNSGNYRLAQDSPCINRGTNNLNWMTNAIDLDGNARIRYGTVDIGAYEIIYEGTIYTAH